LQEQLDREYQNHIRNQSAMNTRVTTPPRVRNENSRHNNTNLRIPDSIQQDLFDCVVREGSLNQRLNNRNNNHQNNLFPESSINYFNNGRNQSNSVSNLTQAFRFLNDESFVSILSLFK
jgi:hypothetical protein